MRLHPLTTEKPHNGSPIVTPPLAAQRWRGMAGGKQMVQLLHSRIRRGSRAYDLYQFVARDEIRDPIGSQHDTVAGRERHFSTVQRAELFADTNGPHRP